MIDKNEALELLRAKINGNEEYVDPFGINPGPCQYSPGLRPTSKGAIDYPGCLIGQILSDLGASPSHLERMDEMGTVMDISSIGEFPVELDHGAATVFQAAQTAQDNGKPWGQALIEAELTAAAVVPW
jgi:hypothetical protein